MIKIDVNISSEYGIMFLYDSKERPVFPTEAGRLPVMWTSTCLAFSVLSYVDGDARVVLSGSATEPLGTEYFSGKIDCASKSLSLYDHNGFAFASVPLNDSFAQVSLRMSEKSNPDVVLCVIENMKIF